MSQIIHNFTPYWRLMRLDRPVGIYLLLWPTLMGLFLAAKGIPDFGITSLFVAGVIIMRSAGCVINDYADRKFDPHVQRTKNRPLATGELQAKNALWLFCGLIGLALVIALQLSLKTLMLASIGALLTIIYPFAKRFTFYPQFILGLAFAWGIPLAYAELCGVTCLQTWILYFSVIAWVVAYDTQYAMIDKVDDLQAGIKSTAIAFGDWDKFWILVLQLLAITGIGYIGYSINLSPIFYAGVLLAIISAVYQQYLIKDRIPELCLRAFINNNLLGAFLCAGIIFGF